MILVTSNSYKGPLIPLKGLRPYGRLILITNPVEPSNIHLHLNLLQIGFREWPPYRVVVSIYTKSCQIAQNLLEDEFGVTTKNMLYNKKRVCPSEL